MPGPHLVGAGSENMRRERTAALLDRVALAARHAPLSVGDGVAAAAGDEPKAHPRGEMGEGDLRELARLHRDIAAGDGIGVAIGADDGVVAGIEAQHYARP